MRVFLKNGWNIGLIYSISISYKEMGLFCYFYGFRHVGFVVILVIHHFYYSSSIGFLAVELHFIVRDIIIVRHFYRST